MEPPTKDKLATASDAPTVGPTGKRFFILAMFITLSLIKSFQWVCLASITNVVADFYGVDNLAINWTAILFMVTFLVLALPVGWLMELIGLRNSVLVGSAGVTLGLVIKCFSCRPDGFLLGMLGHTLVGLAEPFFFSVYSRLASVWFPDDQVALATSAGILGNELGVALGFIVPVWMVGGEPAAVQRGLEHMFVGLALMSALNTLLIALFFDEQPCRPPGLARLQQLDESAGRERISFRKQLATLAGMLANPHFALLLASFGLNVGTQFALHTLLNQMILGPAQEQQRWQDGNRVVGNAGLILLLAGLVGLLVCGRALDLWHQFKLTAVLTQLASLLFMCLSTWLLLIAQELPLYLVMLPLGFSLLAYGCCGFEYAVELTYPSSEMASATLLNMSAQIFGIPISLVGSAIADSWGQLATGVFFCLNLLVALLLACLQGGQLARQLAVREKQRQLRPEAGQAP